MASILLTGNVTDTDKAVTKSPNTQGVTTEYNRGRNEGKMARLVIIGGSIGSSNTASKDVFMYNVTGKHIKWFWVGSDRNVAFAWSSAGAASHGSDLFIAGGFRQEETMVVYDRTAKFNVLNNTWTELPPMNYNRHYRPAVFVIGQKLYAAAGNKNIVNIESLDLNDPIALWEEESVSLPSGVSHSASVVVMETVYMSGGFNGVSNLSTLMSWKPGEYNWMLKCSMMVVRSGHCLITDGYGSIWAIGGCLDCWPMNYIEQYNISDNSWRTVKGFENIAVSSEESMDATICFYHDGYVFFRAHGTIDDGAFYRYNVVTGEWGKEKASVRQLLKNPIVALVPL